MRWRYVLTATVLLGCLAAGGAAWASGGTVEQPVHRTPVATMLR